MGLRAVVNPAAGGQPGAFTTLTVTGAATIGGGLAVTGIQTITADSASPGLEVTNSGGGFSARFSGGAIYALNGMLTNDDIGLWSGNPAKKIGFDGSGNITTTSGLAVTGSISATAGVTANTLRVNVTPTAEVVVATHTAVFNINGTNYKFLCLAA